jgi:protein TonB
VRVAGIFLSAIGHGALIGLAAIAPPFLRPHRERPVPVVVVSLLSEADLAALAPKPEAAPVETPPPAPAPADPPRAAPPEASPTEEQTTEPTLAPAFDPTAPLGFSEESPPPPALPPARQGSGVASPEAGESGGFVILAPDEAPPDARPDPAVLRAAYEEEVRKAVARARVYPQVARDRGLEGSVRFHLVVTREGRLLTAQVIRSSGAMTLDRAGLETLQRAKLPPAPAEIPNQRISLEVEVDFAGSDR